MFLCPLIWALKIPALCDKKRHSNTRPSFSTSSHCVSVGHFGFLYHTQKNKKKKKVCVVTVLVCIGVGVDRWNDCGACVRGEYERWMWQNMWMSEYVMLSTPFATVSWTRKINDIWKPSNSCTHWGERVVVNSHVGGKGLWSICILLLSNLICC